MKYTSFNPGKNMIVESLNIGLPKKEIFHGREIITGICKQPVTGRLHLERSGFEGDGVGDLKHHGGNDKAVCVYSLEHYPYWEDVLGIKLPAAAFGENLTVSDLKEEDICIGDIFELGTALLQVSQPRQPCRTLAARYGRDDLVKLVADSGYTGFYFRVLKEGIVEKGASAYTEGKRSARNNCFICQPYLPSRQKKLRSYRKGARCIRAFCFMAEVISGTQGLVRLTL